VIPLGAAGTETGVLSGMAIDDAETATLQEYYGLGSNIPIVLEFAS
jgi:hypothetical protein